MHADSALLLAKSIVAGVTVTAAATADKVILAQTDVADIGAWGKIVAEYGVLVGLAIYFLWRDWKREKQSDGDKKEAMKLAHDREMESLRVQSEQNELQHKSRENREIAMREQLNRSERAREALQSELFRALVFMQHTHPNYIVPKNLRDTDPIIDGDTPRG